jgi:hypothetical protein
MKDAVFYLANSRLVPILYPVITDTINDFLPTLFEKRFRLEGRRIYATAWRK